MIELFADDTMLYLAGKNLNHMQNMINSKLSKLFKWLCNNQLCVSKSKTTFCLFAKKSHLPEGSIVTGTGYCVV